MPNYTIPRKNKATLLLQFLSWWSTHADKRLLGNLNAERLVSFYFRSQANESVQEWMGAVYVHICTELLGIGTIYILQDDEALGNVTVERMTGQPKLWKKMRKRWRKNRDDFQLPGASWQPVVLDLFCRQKYVLRGIFPKNELPLRKYSKTNLRKIRK